MIIRSRLSVLFLLELFGVIAILVILSFPTVVPFLWILPLFYLLVIPVLLNTVFKAKFSLFYILFVFTVFLRYVIHPVLISVTGEAVETAINASISSNTMTKAAVLMVYELLVTTLVIWMINYNNTVRDSRLITSDKIDDPLLGRYVLPRNTSIYKVVIFVSLILVLLFPRSMSFFSFAVVSLGRIDTATMSVFEQIAVIFIITSKYFAHILILTWLKKKNDESLKNKKFYSLIALLCTLVFGCFYYGTNRLIYLFTFVASLFLYRIVWGKFSKVVLSLFLFLGVIILGLLTQARNYYNYYTGLTGLKYYLFSVKSIINAYLGGISNVGVAINTAEIYGGNATLGNLVVDLLRPIVGLNKLLPVRDKELSNSFYNYVFFGDDTIVSQIMPMIGYGYYYFGGAFAPAFNIVALWLFSVLEKMRSKTMRIELIFMFLTISMRLSTLFGINMIIINNELSMQIIFPLFVYWLNNKISIKQLSNR